MIGGSNIFKKNICKKHISILTVVLAIVILTTVILVNDSVLEALGLRTVIVPRIYAIDENKDQHIVEYFGVNLNDYRKVISENLSRNKRIYKSTRFEGNENCERLLLCSVRFQIPNKNSNKAYSIYIKKDNTEGIAFTQDFEGVYSFYKLEIDEDSTFGWVVTETKQIQGESEELQKYLDND